MNSALERHQLEREKDNKMICYKKKKKMNVKTQCEFINKYYFFYEKWAPNGKTN